MVGEKGWSTTQVGKVIGVTRGQAHHIMSGRSSTPLDRLAGLARALQYEIVLELLPAKEAVQLMVLRKAAQGLDDDTASLVARFARLASAASEDQRSVWDAEFEIRERILERNESGTGGTSSPSTTSTRNTSA